MSNIAQWYHRVTGASTLKRLSRRLVRIEELESQLKPLADAQLAERYGALRAAGERPLDARLEETFALVREAGRRTLGLRAYDVQMLAGLVLSRAMLAEMKTGEGKTLAIAAPAALAALSGQGVHVVTANPYLARRDAATLRPLYTLLGLTVGVVEPQSSNEEKRQAYAADITYSVNYELGFDYLRDNMVRHRADRVQRGLNWAIVDEVDSILIDDARTPLILSGLSEAMSESIVAVDSAFRTLDFAEDLFIDEKEGTATPTDSGYSRIEQFLSERSIIAGPGALYRAENLHLLVAVHAAARAWGLYRRDRHYVVQDGKVCIVDEGTGRLMAGRRWGAGLHEAVEAKERVAIEPQTRTEASITYQSFFGLYRHLAGLTGTAMTEADEFAEIYGLQCVAIPTHRPVIREDAPDRIFATKAQKWDAVLDEVRERHGRGQPILLGTANVADAQHVSRLLDQAGLRHEVLSARNHEREAAVIAQAGAPGAITVATNMAGRGTDIVLGGHLPEGAGVGDRHLWRAQREAVLAAGGLAVLGTERHESRRVDNQLRGRSGRQGDPGYSCFFISMEDTVLRVFGGKTGHKLLTRFADQAVLTGPAVGKFVEQAQRALEEHGFGARKQLLQFDHICAQQREAVYGLRESLFESESVRELLRVAVTERVEDLIAQYVPDVMDESGWDLKGLKTALKRMGVDAPVLRWMTQGDYEHDERTEVLETRLTELLQARLDAVLQAGTEVAATAVFDALDENWSGHLSELEELRASMDLQGKAGQNPMFVFAREARNRFESFGQGVRAWALQVVLAGDASELESDTQRRRRLERQARQTVNAALTERWVTRNEPCPCGSGKRFKHCHGRLAA